MTTPRPPAPQPLTARPLSIASCSWDTLVAELGDPLAGRVVAPAAGVFTSMPAGYRPAVVTEHGTVPLRLRATGATASHRAARP